MLKTNDAIFASRAVVLPDERTSDSRIACVHCGLDCPPNPPRMGDHAFCCSGCRTVYQILSENGMQRFYTIDAAPGVRPPESASPGYATLDQPDVRRRIVDFSNGKITRVTFRIPVIHCAACVWLLENLYRLVPGVGRSEVNFPRKEVTIFIEDDQVLLSALAGKLSSLGYPPELKLDRLSSAANTSGYRRLLLQVGVAGFAFGNVMMMSFPSYLGLDPARESALHTFFGAISLVLAIPVLLFSAQDFFRGAWTGLRQRFLTIDFPIALGIAALFLQSLVDITLHSGEGYLDSFTGLVFLLLCGKWFQRRTFDALAFDRDYRSYFPLSVKRRKDGVDEQTALTDLKPGDRVIIRHGELVPADAVVMSGEAHLDYSFVTGESEPSPAAPGEYVYAGGRQVGGMLELELVKDVSQSYLTSLWNNEAFRKPRERDLQNLTNQVGRWFTAAVVVIAAATAVYWTLVDPSMLARTFSAVLIVACPCALSLAAPYTFSTAQRHLGKAGLFLRSPSVVESLAQVRDIVFDKTGTLTHGSNGSVEYVGAPLGEKEQEWIALLAQQSSHPASRAIAEFLVGRGILPSRGSPGIQPSPKATADTAVRPTKNEESFNEEPGKGIHGVVDGHEIQIGSAGWVGVDVPDIYGAWVKIDGIIRGRYLTGQQERDGLAGLSGNLGKAGYRIALLSGDRPMTEPRFRELFGAGADLQFNASPHDKLNHIKNRQSEGRRVLMIGDGLNDAGALKQSDAGIAVSDDVTLFSPACDAILAGPSFTRLPEFLRFSRASLVVLKMAFAVSLVYNVVGISFAASGALSPLVSAILMPLSSFSVIGFSLLATSLAARKTGVTA